MLFHPQPRWCSRWFFVGARVWLLLLMAAILGGGNERFAKAQTAPNRVWIIVVPGLRPDDLDSSSLPAFDALSRQASSGWMVCRTARVGSGSTPALAGDRLASQLLTLGSGARADAPSPSPVLPPSANEASAPARPAPAPFALPQNYLDTLRKRNDALDHLVTPGALGELARQAGSQTALCGVGGAKTRALAALLLMDRQGRVDAAVNFPDQPASAASSNSPEQNAAWENGLRLLPGASVPCCDLSGRADPAEFFFAPRFPFPLAARPERATRRAAAVFDGL